MGKGLIGGLAYVLMPLLAGGVIIWLLTGGVAAIAIGRLVGFGSILFWMILAFVLIKFMRR